MSLLGNLASVLVAGPTTALATGLGAVPFFFVEEVTDRWNVVRGFASGVVLSASTFGPPEEGLAAGVLPMLPLLFA